MARKTARGGTASMDDAGDNPSMRRTGGARKRRRWKTRRPNPKPEIILPPETQLAFAGSLSRGYLRSYIAAVNQVLRELYKRYDGGDRIAILEAIDVCSAFLPAWVREGFHEALEQYRQHKVKTFDEALGIKRPKGQHLKAARNREVLRPQIIFEVYYRHAKGAPLDQGMFEGVGRDFGISGGEASKIFGEPESDDLREIIRNLKISNFTT